MKVKIKVKKDHLLPKYATKGSCGADLRADIQEEMVLKKGDSGLIPTGVFLELPMQYEAQIRPRSGLALKKGVTVLNTPGTIDSDYRNEIGVILINHGKEDFIIKPNMRIAQIVIAKVVIADFEHGEMASSSRKGGFGHTGSM